MLLIASGGVRVYKPLKFLSKTLVNSHTKLMSQPSIHILYRSYGRLPEVFEETLRSSILIDL